MVGWFIWSRFAAAGENVTRVNVGKPAGRDRNSAPSSTIANDQVRRDVQDAQAIFTLDFVNQLPCSGSNSILTLVFYF